MSNLVVSIDEEISQYIGDKKQTINIYNLFNTFGVDLHFLLKEKKYNKKFMESLEKGNYITSNTF